MTKTLVCPLCHLKLWLKQLERDTEWEINCFDGHKLTKDEMRKMILGVESESPALAIAEKEA